jgi:hypothetical protein
LSGFLPYPALIDTLLHELAHNEVGPHNEQFWHLFCQLKADYLRHLLRLSATGDLFGGKSPISLAAAAAETADVRTAVLAALARDRQAPASALQAQLLDGYLGATEHGMAPAGRSLGGGGAEGRTEGAAGAPLSAAERREMLAAKASARIAGVAAGAAGSVHDAEAPGDEAGGVSAAITAASTATSGEPIGVGGEPSERRGYAGDHHGASSRPANDEAQS